MRAIEMARRWTPTAAWDAALRVFSSVYGFRGNFDSFEAALAECGPGYQAESVTRAAAKAARAAAASAGDGGVFELPLAHCRQLAAMGRVVATVGGQVRVLDLGGSWGKHYFECARLFGAETFASWDVLETDALVASVADPHRHPAALRFHSRLEELSLARYSLAFASSSLQYLPDPESTLARFCDANVPFILLDRLPVLDAARHRVTVQTVPPWIHAAKHPAWFFSRELLSRIWSARGYQVSVHWLDPDDRPFLDGERVIYEGFLLQARR